MSSPVDLRVGRARELLEQLQGTVASFAEREATLYRELRVRRQALTRRHQDAAEQLARTCATERTDSETTFSAEESRLRGIFERRRARIDRARAELVHDLRARARREKERWVSDLQIRHLRTERGLPRDLKATDAALQEGGAQLAEEREAIGGIERRARSALRGYPSLSQSLAPAAQANAEPAAQVPLLDQLFEELRAQLTAAEEQFAAVQKLIAPRVFRYLPLPLLIPLVLLGAVLCGASGVLPWSGAAVVTGVLLVAVVAAYVIGLRGVRPAAELLARSLSEARRLHDQCGVSLHARHEQDRQRLQEEYEATMAEIHERWSGVEDREADFERAVEEKIESQVPRLLAQNERMWLPRLREVETEHAARREALAAAEATRKQMLAERQKNEMGALIADELARWEGLATEWERTIGPIPAEIAAMNAATEPHAPAWSAALVDAWTAPKEFAPATKFAQLEVDVAKAAGALPKHPRLALPGSPHVSIPLALTFPDQGSLLLETRDSGNETVLATLNNIILRLLATTPPGKLAFTILDPVGLGHSFAGLMHLSDYEESLITRRIWTQRDQIEERLAELSEHIEKVIQMYLRNEYATITEYNEQAGSVAEKYHFLVVADFPANFGESAVKRLQSIAASGPRCGIYTLIHWDQRHPAPDGFVADELRKSSVSIREVNGRYVIGGAAAKDGVSLVFDPPPDPELAVQLVHKIGQSSIDSNRVEVPFAQIAPADSELWTNETTSELRIAVGRTGATKHQYLAIGKGTRQHALFAGKTGSGKSTLFHVIITNLALACSPEQVEFYLIDFKKGVEFKCYAEKRLPHARVVAIESDREFALSVLQRVDEELKRRGDMFRKLGVQDIAGYKREGGTEPMPRSLLLIDEFQEFFVEDDQVAQTASLLFDRIVRQGRAFGIHVLLGSQSLGGAYSLARATLGQMVIRVALQCNEADAYLIMDDSNSAPRLLSRPGEGIYNDAGGAVEGNSPFQVVWLPDQERDQWLDKVSALAETRNGHRASPIVFEGNAPADIRENDALRVTLAAAPAAAPASARCWLGAPNSIKGPTEVVFQRQSGNHLLVVGQRDEPTLTMVGLSLLALAAQFPAGAVKLVLLHTAPPGTADATFLERIVSALPQRVTVAGTHDVGAVMEELATDLKARAGSAQEAAAAPATFVVIHGLHRFKKLRHEDDFSFSASSETSPSAQLAELIAEGSSLGIHLIATIDTFNNVNRFLSRKALTEFEMRVVFQMSANDSASLIDSPKASTLGLHRALLYNEHQGTLETFRPYAVPDEEWLGAAAAKPVGA